MVFFKDNTVVVTCSCGCDDVLIIRELGGYIYVSSATSSFMEKQRGDYIYHVKKKLKNVSFDLRKKPVILHDICMNGVDVKEFIDAISSITFEDEDEDGDDVIYKNMSYLALEELDFSESYKDDLENRLFQLYIVKKKNISSLNRKLHRAYEICYSKKQWLRFIEKCKKVSKMY